MPTSYQFSPEMLTQPKMTMTVRTRGIDTPSEAFVLVNGEVAYYLPPNNSNGIETTTLEVETRYFRPDNNSIEVYYDVDKVTRDPRKGFMLYYLDFR